MLIRKLNINLVTLHSNGLANLMIGSLMNMSLLIKNLTNYVQTKTDKEDAKLLRKLLTDDLSEQEQMKIIRHVFSDLIKWSYDDLVIHLTQVFNFTDQILLVSVLAKPYLYGLPSPQRP